MSTGKKKKNGGRAATARAEDRRDSLYIDRFSAQSKSFIRRMSGGQLTISTGAGGTVALQTLASSANVSALAPDFSSCANLYVAYRVLAIEVLVMPFFPVNTTAVTVPVTMVVAPFQAGTGATTYGGLVDTSRSVVTSGYRSGKFYADAKQDKNAQLWTPITAAIGASNAFGLQVIGDAVACTASTPVWRSNLWYLVEFRTAA